MERRIGIVLPNLKHRSEMTGPAKMQNSPLPALSDGWQRDFRSRSPASCPTTRRKVTSGARLSVRSLEALRFTQEPNL
jgi:hypothetical protein